MSQGRAKNGTGAGRRDARRPLACALAAGLTLSLGGLSLGGCSRPASVNPVDWWHGLEGGKIEEQRPPPPKADAPYPNLSTVPAKPVVIGPAARHAIADALVADRTNAQYAASAVPVMPTPGTFARPAVPPAAASASLDAASAQPAPQPESPHAPPRTAPRGTVRQADLPVPAPVLPASTPETADAVAAVAAMPDTPPPAPHIEGVPVPAVTAPSPPPVAPPPPPVPPAPDAGPNAVVVSFTPGETGIAGASLDALRALVAKRGAAPMVVTAYGDGGDDSASQASALPLAMARARAIAAVLMAAGVPASLIGIDASAEGHGGAARIAN